MATPKPTQADIRQALRISNVLQTYFDKNPKAGTLNSVEAYAILKRDIATEVDRHDGIKFRQFLAHMEEHNALDLIPQCRFERVAKNKTNWHFNSAPGKTIRTKGNLTPLYDVNTVKTLDIPALVKLIKTLPALQDSELTDIQAETRQKYPRAYDLWTEKEESMLQEAAKEIPDDTKLSALFQRQPSAIKARLLEKFAVVI